MTWRRVAAAALRNRALLLCLAPPADSNGSASFLLLHNNNKQRLANLTGIFIFLAGKRKKYTKIIFPPCAKVNGGGRGMCPDFVPNSWISPFRAQKRDICARILPMVRTSDII